MAEGEPTPEQRQRYMREYSIVQGAVDQPGEHFDSVEVFVTRHEHGLDGGTRNYNAGSGNWFARFGQIEDWVERVHERVRMNVRSAD